MMTQRVLDKDGNPLPASDPMLTERGQLAFMQMMVIALVKRLGGAVTVLASEVTEGGPYDLRWVSHRLPEPHINMQVLGPDGKPIYKAEASEQPVHNDAGKLN